MDPFSSSFSFEYVLVAVGYVYKWVEAKVTRHYDAKLSLNS